jgi:exopolysaccharide biosynthesis predicted pyruvyltransferase EpsI
MIERATLELFARAGIACRLIQASDLQKSSSFKNIDMLAAPGGGSVGEFYTASPKLRAQISRVQGCDKILLPQSAFDSTEDLSAFTVVFAREIRSFELMSVAHPDVRLAPDMALSLAISAPKESRQIIEGVFMRRDRERTHNAEGVDLTSKVKTADDYIRRAGEFGIIKTNRLHLAIAAALQDRQVFLRPNSYHKNRSMFETWLRLFPNVKWENV